MKTGLTITGIVVGLLALLHCCYWALAKGLIRVMLSLFDINWYGKFWEVYILILIVSCVFGGPKYTPKR